MSRSSEAYQAQQEQDNLSGMDDYEAWFAENEGKFACPYCNTITDELVLCCGEVHGIEIGV